MSFDVANFVLRLLGGCYTTVGDSRPDRDVAVKQSRPLCRRTRHIGVLPHVIHIYQIYNSLNATTNAVILRHLQFVTPAAV